MIRRMLASLLGRHPTIARAPMRLSDAEAVAIAATVTGRADLGVQKVERDGVRVVWTIGTRNRGVNEWVRIADDTGEVLEHRRAGLR